MLRIESFVEAKKKDIIRKNRIISFYSRERTRPPCFGIVPQPSGPPAHLKRRPVVLRSFCRADASDRVLHRSKKKDIIRKNRIISFYSRERTRPPCFGIVPQPSGPPAHLKRLPVVLRSFRRADASDQVLHRSKKKDIIRKNRIISFYSRERTRTSDLRVMSPTSCQLLYPASLKPIYRY